MASGGLGAGRCVPGLGPGFHVHSHTPFYAGADGHGYRRADTDGHHGAHCDRHRAAHLHGNAEPIVNRHSDTNGGAHAYFRADADSSDRAIYPHTDSTAAYPHTDSTVAYPHQHPVAHRHTHPQPDANRGPDSNASADRDGDTHRHFASDGHSGYP